MSIISLWERVREWTLVAHWESAISPSKTLSSAPRMCGPSAAKENKTGARNKNGLTFIATHLVFSEFCKTRCNVALRFHQKLHIHLFVVMAADNRADHEILTCFTGRGKREFLSSGLEQQIPAIYGLAILGAQQGESVNGAIAVAAFGFVGGDAQDDRLAGLHGDDRLFLARDFVTAVVIGQDLDHPGLRLAAH